MRRHQRLHDRRSLAWPRPCRRRGFRCTWMRCCARTVLERPGPERSRHHSAHLGAPVDLNCGLPGEDIGTQDVTLSVFASRAALYTCRVTQRCRCCKQPRDERRLVLLSMWYLAGHSNGMHSSSTTALCLPPLCATKEASCRTHHAPWAAPPPGPRCGRLACQQRRRRMEPRRERSAFAQACRLRRGG
jgi:hypothetical protein